MDMNITVTIAGGATTNTVVVTVAASEDVFTEEDQVTDDLATDFSVTDSGPFELITPVNDLGKLTVTDTTDNTNATLTVDRTTLTEAGGTITYTVTLDTAVPEGDSVTTTFVDVNGYEQTVTIAGGATTNTVVVTVAASEDVFTEEDQVTDDLATDFSVTDSGPFELITPVNDLGKLTVTDTTDNTNATLTVDRTTLTEAGGTITYTVTLDTAVPEGDSVTTTFVDVNGYEQTVTIAGGATTNTVVVTVAASEDVFTEEDQVTDDLATDFSVTDSGPFELITPVNDLGKLTVTDTTDNTNATLTVDRTTLTEAGGTITYTVTLDTAVPSGDSVTTTFVDVNGV
jgi:hypothetical protein